MRKEDGVPTPRHRASRTEGGLARTHGGDVEAVAATAAYRELVDRLREHIAASQARAAVAVNAELVMLYWSIGREILEQQRACGWGNDVVGHIAQDLAADARSPRGFSRRNVFYMRRFAALWPEREKVPSPMALIGWTANRVLLDRFAPWRRSGERGDHPLHRARRDRGQAGAAPRVCADRRLDLARGRLPLGGPA
jgi:DUF1016 N-terminal domain